MAKQISPFAALTGSEKQIRWLEYQSIRLPYVHANLDDTPEQHGTKAETETQGKAEPKMQNQKTPPIHQERPVPPPEVPRTVNEFQKVRHTQYDAVIARMKQAELQARRYQAL